MLAPERRSRFDLVAAAAIVVAVLVAITLAWQHGDARGTTSITATKPAGQVAPAVAVPAAVHEIWRHGDGAVATPLVVGGAVVTADGGTVTGRDPLSGNEIWRYQRDMPLCGVQSAWGTAVAVYRDRRGCSQVTELEGSTGRRLAQRSSYADDSVHIGYDGTYLTSYGSNRLELWRSDLVRTLEYGYIDAPNLPDGQPRKGCTLVSAASSSSRLAVLEQCKGEDFTRLSLLNPAPKDNQKVEEQASIQLPELPAGVEGARVLTVSGDRTVLFLPGDASSTLPRIGVYDASAKLVTQYPLSVPVTATDAPADVVVRKIGSIYSFWTGTKVVALDQSSFAPLWVADSGLGPGVSMAGRMLLPVANGIAVLDPRTGQASSWIPVERNGFTGPVTLAVLGGVVLEQRGSEVVALSG